MTQQLALFMFHCLSLSCSEQLHCQPIVFCVAHRSLCSFIPPPRPFITMHGFAGLVPPAVAVHIMGKGGAALVLIMLFMAVTSTGSAEQIAVSSLFAYDVYREYFNREATGKDVRL